MRTLYGGRTMKFTNGVTMSVLKKVWVLILIMAECVWAQSPPPVLDGNGFGPWYLANAEKGWHVDSFLGMGNEPTYAGSDDYESELEANVRAVYRSEAGHRYYLALGELGALFALSPRSQLVVALEYEEGRSADDDPLFEHFDDIDSTVEGQLSYFYRWGTTYASVVLQPDLLGRGKGFVWFVAVAKDWEVSNDWRVSASLDLSGANSEYMQTEFGVSEQAALASGLEAFTISGGLKSASMGLSTEYFFSPRWSVVGQVEVERYLGDIVDSPLVKDEGSETGYEMFIGLRYRF